MELISQPTLQLRPNPIKFPRFTFLIGGRDSQPLDLAKALIRRDPDMEAASMWTPVYEAASVFWQGDYELFPRLLAQSSDIPSDLWDYINDQMKLPFPLLSRVAITRVESVLDLTADRILYTDAVYDFIPPFQSRWGRAEIADKLDERLAQLEREFGVIE